MRARVTAQVLVGEAHVSRDIIARVLHQQPVSQLKANLVFDALNRLNGGKLKQKAYVVAKRVRTKKKAKKAKRAQKVRKARKAS